MTAVVIAGPHAHRQAGPIVIAVEDIAHLAPMLRAAGRFSLTTSGDIAIALFGNSPAETEWMEGQVRLAVDLGARVALLPLCPDHDAPAIGAYLANCAPGLLIARFGGLAVPGDEDLAELSCALSCPLLLVR